MSAEESRINKYLGAINAVKSYSQDGEWQGMDLREINEFNSFHLP